MTTFDFNWLSGAIDSLTTQYSGLFLAEGQFILHWLGIIVLITYCLKWALESVSRWHGTFNLPGLVHFFVAYLIAETMLRYYNSPLPWTSVSLHQILPDTARTYANWIDNTRFDIMLLHIQNLLANLERPNVGDLVLIPIYFLVELDMWLIEALLFGATAMGFVALAIGALLGPLFIPWFVVPRLSGFFWKWLEFMLQYSFYRVVAAALTFVWSTAVTSFIDGAVAGDYSLAHFTVLLAAMFVIVFAMAWSILRITSYVSDLFAGTAAAGSNLIGSVTATLGAIL